MKNQQYLLSIVLGALFCLSSCTDILFDNNHDGIDGLDFTSGNWLLNEIKSESPDQSVEHLTDKAIDGLTKMGVTSVKYFESAGKNEIFPEEIPFLPDQATLESIKESSGFDYLFNIKVNVFQDGGGGIAFGEQDLENQVAIEFMIFDIKLGKKIYYQETIATELWPMDDEMEERPSRFSFTRSTKNMLGNALRRGLREMKKNMKL